jgi:hypothetical protein
VLWYRRTLRRTWVEVGSVMSRGVDDRQWVGYVNCRSFLRGDGGRSWIDVGEMARCAVEGFEVFIDER